MQMIKEIFTQPERLYLQAQNMVLRLLPLIFKLGLILYMGRYLSYEEMGRYGLVFGAVLFIVMVLGQRLDYVVARDIIGASPIDLLHKLRDEALYFIMNYALLGLGILIAALIGIQDLPPKYLFYILVLSVLEHYANALNDNLISLNRQRRASVLFFIRSAAWVIPVVLIGLWSPALRTADAVLVGWIAGCALCLAAGAWSLRALPWDRLFTKPVDCSWLKTGLKKTYPIWFGTFGLAAGTYLDRFVVAHYLSLEEVGVLTFYFSFVSAIQSLIDSGVSAYSYPSMIAHHNAKDTSSFRKEDDRTRLLVGVVTFIIAIAIGVVVPMIGGLIGKQAFVDHAPALWLMLVGGWFRIYSSSYFIVLYARHQDRAVWLGSFLFPIPSFISLFLFVPAVGLNGVGISAIVAGLFLLLWRRWHVDKGYEETA